MPKNFVRKTFDRWIARNRRHFKYQPIIVKSRKDFLELKFDGIAPELSWIVAKKGDCMITVDYNGECRDIVWEADLWERRDSGGLYYCDGCLPEYRKFYPSRRELWEEHCFKAMMEWADGTFIGSNRLYICGVEGSYTAAYIRPEGEMEDTRSRENLLVAQPVIRPGKSR